PAPRFVFSTGGLIVAQVRCSVVEIIDQVDNYLSAARLAREVIVLARQHMAIQSQANFHKRWPHESGAIPRVLCWFAWRTLRPSFVSFAGKIVTTRDLATQM